MSDFATHLANVAEAAHQRWRLKWEPTEWNLVLTKTKAAAAAATQAGGDFSFILFVLTSYRWRHIVPSRAAIAAHTFLRRLVKAYESAVKEAGGPIGMERWLAPILGHQVVLVHDERNVFDEDLLKGAAPFKGRPTVYTVYGGHVRSERLNECIEVLDWYLRSRGVSRPAAVIARVMSAFEFPGVSSGRKALNWVHSSRHRMRKITPQTDGALLRLILQFHKQHKKLHIPCGFPCSQLPPGDRAVAVTHTGRSGRRRFREHLLLMPVGPKDRPQ